MERTRVKYFTSTGERGLCIDMIVACVEAYMSANVMGSLMTDYFGKAAMQAGTRLYDNSRHE